jgi:hypothetical protein
MIDLRLHLHRSMKKIFNMVFIFFYKTKVIVALFTNTLINDFVLKIEFLKKLLG